MIKYCLIVLLGTLVGCSTAYAPTKTEHIEITAWAEEKHDVYLIAESVPVYQFSNEQLLPVLQFLQSPLGERVAHLSALIEEFANQRANARFFFYIPATDLSDDDKASLLYGYQFEIFKPLSSSFVYSIPALQEALTTTDTLYIKQWKLTEGRITLGEALPVAKVVEFASPMKTEVRHLKGELRMTPNLVESVIWAPFMLPLIPLGALSQ